MTHDAGGSDRASIEVATIDDSYSVHVGRGILAELPEFLERHVSAHRFAVISDDQVGPLHGEHVREVCRAAGLDVILLTFPAGEASKTREWWSRLTDDMLDAGLGRDSCVIGVGGGVTTDLAGFVAATYMRGVPVVQVPTSYLAMIDASVGGKTGVDVNAGKNLVGAFHAPSVVVADTALLSTLPRHECAQGLVEAFKHGAILDVEYFEELSTHVGKLLDAAPDVAGPAIFHSVELKAGVVGRDQFEGGYRQILNFGHTIGHAIEAASRYRLGHGSAVALGMLAEAEIGEGMGVTEKGTRHRLRAAMADLLPGEEVSISCDEAFEYLDCDKKARGGRARYVLLKRLGDVDPGDGWTHDVPGGLARDALERVVAES